MSGAKARRKRSGLAVERNLVENMSEKALRVDVEVERQEGGTVAISITVDRESVEAEVERVYRDFARRLDVPGFRRGRVPMAIAQKYLDRETARAQAVENLVPRAYAQAIEQAGLRPVETADVEESDLDEQGALRIRASVSVRPEVKLGDYRGLKASKRVDEVSDEQVDAEIGKIAARLGRYEEITGPIEAGDLVKVDYALTVDGNRKDEAQGYFLEVGADKLFPELNKALVGASVGSELKVPVSFSQEHSDEALRGRQGEYVVTVTEARRRVTPELNDELARRLGDFEDLADLRKTVRSVLERTAEALAERDVRRELVRQVVEGSYVEPPDVLVERELESRMADIRHALAESGLTMEQYLARIDSDMDELEREQKVLAVADVKRALILGAVGEVEGIEVTPGEIDAEIERLVERSETPAKTRRLLSTEAERSRVRSRLYQEKIVDLIRAAAEVTTESRPVQAGDEEGAAVGEPQEPVQERGA